MNIDAHARAIALRERARHAIDLSRELTERTATSQARLAKVQADLVATRRAHLAQRATEAGVPWARALRGFARVDVDERPLSRRTPAYAPSPTAGPSRRERRAGAWSGGQPGVAGPVLAERAVYDGHGEEWLVREFDTTGLPAARLSRCLIFENHHAVRRVWHYPGDWQMIGDATLLALSEETV